MLFLTSKPGVGEGDEVQVLSQTLVCLPFSFMTWVQTSADVHVCMRNRQSDEESKIKCIERSRVWKNTHPSLLLSGVLIRALNHSLSLIVGLISTVTEHDEIGSR